MSKMLRNSCTDPYLLQEEPQTFAPCVRDGLSYASRLLPASLDAVLLCEVVHHLPAPALPAFYSNLYKGNCRTNTVFPQQVCSDGINSDPTALRCVCVARTAGAAARRGGGHSHSPANLGWIPFLCCCPPRLGRQHISPRHLQFFPTFRPLQYATVIACVMNPFCR